MRIVVGGPNPSNRPGVKLNSSPSSRHPSSPRRHPPPPYSQHENPYGPPAMPYPHPPGPYVHHPNVYPHNPPAGSYPYHYPSHHAPPHMPMYGTQHPPVGSGKMPLKKMKLAKHNGKGIGKRKIPLEVKSMNSAKKPRKSSPSSAKKKNKSPQITDRQDHQKAAATIHSVNAASGGKNNKAAALAAAIMRGVTMRPSGKWQAQLYFAGKSRYIGVFDTREKAALAYEIAREKLKSEKAQGDGVLSPKATEAAVNTARKAAFEGVNERDPRLSSLSSPPK